MTGVWREPFSRRGSQRALAQREQRLRRLPPGNAAVEALFEIGKGVGGGGEAGWVAGAVFAEGFSAGARAARAAIATTPTRERCRRGSVCVPERRSGWGRDRSGSHGGHSPHPAP